MRIAFVTFEYPPFIIGGAGVYAGKLTHELARLGHQVVVFTPKINDYIKEKCDIKNIEIKMVKVNKRLPFKALQFWLGLPKAIREAENDRRFDVIHFNGISYWFIKKRISKAPHIITIHHLVEDAIRTNNYNLFTRTKNVSGEISIFIPFIEKRCIKFADKIIAVSNFTKEQIIKVYGISSDKVEVVYNGADADGYTFTSEELEEIKKKFNLPEKPIILFVGRIDDPRKGLDFLLKAFKIVIEKVDSTLLIVGKGDQAKAKELAESLKISNNLVFTGFIDEMTLKRCYALCDIYVCPSRLEGFGLTILEAMSVNKPIVATEVGAIPEIVKNEENGFLVKFNDIWGLSYALCSLLSSEKLMRTIGKRNVIYVNRKYSWENAAKEIEKIYGRIF